MPVGIGYLAEFLKTSGVNYSVLDMGLGYGIGDLKKRIARLRPDIIGISMMSFMYKNHYRLAEVIKEDFPEIPIVSGGPHVSSCGEAVLRECRAIDFGIMREGELPLSALCSGEDLEDIAGLIFRKDGNIRVNYNSGDIDNLDIIPFPRFENFERVKYGFGISVVSSRGCPYQCIYCSAHAIRKRFRARSAANVVDEMEYWYKKGYREFDFQEDNPTFDKVRLLELCNQIEKRGLRDLMIMCGNGIRADRVDKPLLQRMKEVGFRRIAFGVEGGNDRILKNIKKGETIEVVKNAIKDACDLDFFVSLFFVVGSPGETPADVEDSIKIALSYPVSHVNFFNLIPLPNTELYKWVEENNYFILRPQDYLNTGSSIQMSCRPVFATPEFPVRERIRTLKKTKRIERLIKRRAIERKLNAPFIINRMVGWLYTLSWMQKFENNLNRYAFYRKTIGYLKSNLRRNIYKN
jgi:radical SAM superfamily enzyme YgiQ (UPF0313 family)